MFTLKKEKILSLAALCSLASMFAACSDDKPVTGGSAEETGIMAELENITVTGNAYCAVQVAAGEDSSGQSGFVLEGFKARTVVWLDELDSNTFLETGNTFVDTIWNDGEEYKFENITLRSPYVQIRVFGRSLSGVNGRMQAIADVRKTKNINVSILTTMKNAELRYLAAEGVDHAELGSRSERELLDAFGITDTIASFEEKESLQNRNYVLLNAVMKILVGGSYGDPIEWYTVDSLKSSLRRTGTLEGLDQETWARVKKRTVDELFDYREIAHIGHDVWGKVKLAELTIPVEWTRDYVRYIAGILAALSGEGLCVESREGDVMELDVLGTMLVCRSGSWRLEYGEKDGAAPVYGSMTDSRDGRTYKTVTYDIGGKSYTWMAENLRYDDGVGHCYKGESSYCDVYGRFYTWREALALDTSIKWSMEACLEHYRQEYAEEMTADSIEYYMAEFALWCEEKIDESGDYSLYNYSKALELIDSVNLQGVCPDGWRVSTGEDWKKLEKYVVDKYGVPHEDAMQYLYRSEYTDGPLGFGIQLLIKDDLEEMEERRRRRQGENLPPMRIMLHILAPVYAIPPYQLDYDGNEFSDYYLMGYGCSVADDFYSKDWILGCGTYATVVAPKHSQYWYSEGLTETNNFVRCVKN
ncbi:MAG: hypothetical protein IK012_13125 [Fibrobacter sp.]|uniref:FISUMP domain-containing protein n=1 Tax=Fibrobacter sp. TaxID=35828 RepID=UPI0025C300C7|nr:FISUMP domain-containing protein [Fibrobacter sp.]MBR4786174.1 hypothetical protein [Fibrobacter sp.]